MGIADFQKPLVGKELTVGLELSGNGFTAINAGPEFRFSEAVSFVVPCKDQAEIDYCWENYAACPGQSNVAGAKTNTA